ncbi:hypothetical protein [Haemophilus sputorum]|uniref:hypothetical protein n=1 Tax=Haemophilus sputorum TaxID=1078480 RepID=UPI0028CFE44D|nr:hypothetical protein [Haemophilus sputorum]
MKKTNDFYESEFFLYEELTYKIAILFIFSFMCFLFWDEIQIDIALGLFFSIFCTAFISAILYMLMPVFFEIMDLLISFLELFKSKR